MTRVTSFTGVSDPDLPVESKSQMIILCKEAHVVENILWFRFSHAGGVVVGNLCDYSVPLCRLGSWIVFYYGKWFLGPCSSFFIFKVHPVKLMVQETITLYCICHGLYTGIVSLRKLKCAPIAFFCSKKTYFSHKETSTVRCTHFVNFRPNLFCIK